MKCLVLSIELFLMNLKKHDEVRFVWLNEGISSTDVSTEGSLFLMAADPSMRWAPNCWCKLGPKGHQHHNTLLRKGKEPKGHFGGLHLLPPLLLHLLLLLLQGSK
jgi:hypothetical protein